MMKVDYVRRVVLYMRFALRLEGCCPLHVSLQSSLPVYSAGKADQTYIVRYFWLRIGDITIV
jgi:hypothetical protein